MTKEIAVKNITDEVLVRVQKMEQNKELELPSNYSVSNALKSAYLILRETQTRDKRPVLEACTKESICNSLLEMAVQGLNPVKNQCYFIAYGDKLQLQRSYMGTIAITKRLDDVEDVKGFAIYKDDKLEFGFDIATGKQTIKNYEPSLNRDPNNLIGAMALVYGKDKILHLEYMTIEQIKSAWSQGATGGNSPAHKKFPDQMAIKTVINRACKYYANTSDDDFVSSMLEKSIEAVDEEVAETIEINAAKEDFDEGVVEVNPETGEIIEEDVKAPF